MMCDLKSVSTDEGLRLGIINGGKPFLADPSSVTWDEVLQTGKPFAYQPLYFLLQRTVINLTHSESPVLLKLVNIGFLWLSLQGLIALSAGWRLAPRLFLLSAFSFNAYLLMHVLQIREYILGVSIYIWSTWLVLQLVDRNLRQAWRDIAWFAAYGLLLTLGFYVQTWVVFVASAQGLFLVLRRKNDRMRFYAHLALGYLIVLAATLPFLNANPQRIDVGRWGTEGTALLPQLSNGFHLVLAGHLTGHSVFTDFIYWFWLAIVSAAAVLVMLRRADPIVSEAAEAFRHQGLLVLLSVAFPLVFQFAYFYRFDNLSVWPRYFIVHYFFLFWLLSMAVRFLHALAESSEFKPAFRRILRTSLVAVLATLLVSSLYQIRSYYRDPYFDTSLSRSSNWRVLATEIARVLRPDDVLLAHELINQSTLTFSHPFTNQVLLLADLEKGAVGASGRFVYLESVSNQGQRDALANRMATLGFGKMREIFVKAPATGKIVPDWCLLVFQR